MAKRSNLPNVYTPKGCTSKTLDVTTDIKDLLEESGATYVNYGLQIGETVVFPATEEDIVVAAREVRAGNTATEKLLLVTVAKPSGVTEERWLSIAMLRRVDEAKEQTCGTVCEELQPLANDWERVKAACGRTMRANQEVKIQTLVFGADGKPNGETKEKTIITLDWVE